MVAILGICVSAVTAWFIFSFTIYDKLMQDEASRKEYIDELRDQYPGKISIVYRNYLEKGLGKLGDWFDTPFGAKALTINTFLAICYTFPFFIISWIAGRSGKIGTIPILSDSVQIVVRILFVVQFALVFVIMFRHKKIDSSVQKLLAKMIPLKMAPVVYRLLVSVLFVSGALFLKRYELSLLVLFPLVIYSPSFSVVGVFVSVTAIAVTGIFAYEVLFTFSFIGLCGLARRFASIVSISKFELELTAIVAVAGAGAGAIAIAIAIANESWFRIVLVQSEVAVALVLFICCKEKSFLYIYIFCALTIFLLLIGLYFEVEFLELNSSLSSYFFFIIILPFINGFFDFVSFGISRFLGQKILKDRTLKAFLWHFAIDFVAAVLLLGLLVFGICFGVELFNNLVVKKPDLMINLPKLIEDVREAPLGTEGLWITFMLFSTLVPTFAHFVIAFLGVYTIYLTPKKWRQKIADTLEENRSKRSLILPAFYFASRPLVCILSVLVFWGLVVYVVNNNITPLANLLADVAYWGIELAGNIST